MYFPLLSIGDVLQTALLNTVLGMGTVFAVLVFISVLISLFAYIPKIQAAFNKKEKTPEKTQATTAPAPKSASTAAPVQPMDDLELIAVITAAIAASAGVSEDSFVVRSIRRSKANNWNKTI